MPSATEPVNFTWSLPSLTCNHGMVPQGADFRGEFFQKVKETKTTLDRIYLSSLTRNKDKVVLYEYEKWARKGGIPVERKLGVAGSQSSALKHLPRPGPVRPLGVDNNKIEAALQCGLWDEPKKKTRNVKMPHIIARVQCYDFEDDYENDTVNHQGAEYALDSSKVFRVMQEETREQATQRLQKGKCGSLKKRTRRVSPSDHVSESDDDYTSSEVRVTIEEKHSKRRGDIVTNVTHKQKLDFSTIKKRGVTHSDTVDYRLPKLNSKPITRETEEQLPNKDVLKLPLLECLKKGSSKDKKKRSKRCKKLSRNRPKKKSGDEGDESSMRNNIDDDIETALDSHTPIMEEVANKLSDISSGRSGLNTNKSSKHNLYCKKETDDEGLSDYPFLSMGVDGMSDSDEECLCDECLELMASSKLPSSDRKPLKSILSPRRRKQMTASTGSGKSVSFAQTEDLEDIRLISPLAVRNENTKRFEEEERRERLKQRDMKRRERRQRERERFAALNQKFTKKTDARRKTEDDPEQTPAGPETTCSPTLDCVKTSNNTNEDSIEVKNTNAILTETQEENSNDGASQESPTLENEPENGNADDTQIPATPNTEAREVEVLMLDPHAYGRLYEDTVLEKGNGKLTVAQLGYRIKSIFDRDLPPPASPKPSSSTSNDAEIIDHEADTTLPEDEADDTDKPFVTKCVDWNETTESAAASRSPTPVEKTDMSDFILSMKNCRYLRWSKSYVDMLEKMEQ